MSTTDPAPKIPIGPLTQVGPLPLADCPPDRNASRIAPGATVFQRETDYLWLTVQPFPVEKVPGGPKTMERNVTVWCFLPNGRFFTRAISYATGIRQVAESWGRYLIGQDTLTFETDAGERDTMQMVAGRRKLIWHLTYDEVNWLNETLHR